LLEEALGGSEGLGDSDAEGVGEPSDDPESGIVIVPSKTLSAVVWPAAEKFDGGGPMNTSP
jgi:hypothetical protein